MLLMKGQGQTKEIIDQGSCTKQNGSSQLLQQPSKKLSAVPEGESSFDAGQPKGDEKTASSSSSSNGAQPCGKAPLTPVLGSPYDDDMGEDTPLSMDDDDDLPPSPTTDRSILRSYEATDSLSPLGFGPNRLAPDMHLFNQSDPNLSIPGLLPLTSKPMTYARQRSRSVGGEKDDEDQPEYELPPLVKGSVPDASCDGASSTELRKNREVESSINALQVNRQLYRIAHRQMRLSVIEASKQFEEQQTNHARAVLMKAAETSAPAGLVMRRGQNKQISSEAIQNFMDQNRSHQEALVKKANMRGGRGRRTRKKTISDMSGMVGSLSQEESHPASVAAAESPPNEAHTPLVNGVPSLPPILEPTEPANIRGATVPGEFKKVQDPFGVHGKYGSQLT